MSQCWKTERATLKDLTDIELIMRALIPLAHNQDMIDELERRTAPHEVATFYCQKCGKVPGGFEGRPGTKCECAEGEQ